MIVTEEERSEALARFRKRLAFLTRYRSMYRATIKDTRIAIDSMEQVTLLQFSKEKKTNG